MVGPDEKYLYLQTIPGPQEEIVGCNFTSFKYSASKAAFCRVAFYDCRSPRSSVLPPRFRQEY